MSDILNIIRREAARMLDARAVPRIGIVDGYDQERYAARVLLLPEKKLTGWLPIGVQWMGNGWGLLSPVGPGDQVVVEFQEHDKDSGIIKARLYDERNPPPAGVPYGECWLVHKSGSYFKLTNDGKLALHSLAEIDIGDLVNAVKRLVTEDFMALYNSHVHGTSPTPTQQMSAAHLTSILKAN